MIAVTGMPHVARMTGMPFVIGVSSMVAMTDMVAMTGMPAMTTMLVVTAVVMMGVIGMVHGVSRCGMARFSRLHSVMPMILLVVHAPNVYP